MIKYLTILWPFVGLASFGPLGFVVGLVLGILMFKFLSKTEGKSKEELGEIGKDFEKKLLSGMSGYSDKMDAKTIKINLSTARFRAKRIYKKHGGDYESILKSEFEKLSKR
jgi:hypothetical protein